MTRRPCFGELHFTSNGYAPRTKLRKPLRRAERRARTREPDGRARAVSRSDGKGATAPPSRRPRENSLVQMKRVDRLSSAAATNVPTPPKSIPSRSSSRRMPIRSIDIVQAINRTP